MQTDLYTKTVLTIIALLLAFLAYDANYTTTDIDVEMIQHSISTIESKVDSIETNISNLSNGFCTNQKIC